MPSARLVGAVGVAVLGLAALVYSVLVTHQPILGLSALAACILGAFAVAGRVDRRRALTWVVILLVVLLGFVLTRPIVAVIAACAVYLTSWLTGPSGPYTE